MRRQAEPVRVRTVASRELEPLRQSSGPARLRDFTSYDWDRVFLFTPYSLASEGNDTVGGKVLESGDWVPETEDLLVFSLGGHPVVAARTPVSLIYSGLSVPTQGWSRDVLIEPRCGQLSIHEPGQPLDPGDCG